MLTTQQQFEEHLIAHDVVEAAHSMQNCMRRLFYCYDRAVKVFHAEEGDIDPDSIHAGLVACKLGVYTLTSWLREVSTKYAGPFEHEADDLDEWVQEWFNRRDLALSLSDAL